MGTESLKTFLLFVALPLFPQSLDTGKRIFDSQCALCHGPDGSGGRGPNLRKARLTKAPDDEALKKAIADGLPPEMPGAWQLHPREVAATAAYVRSLGKIDAEEIPGVASTGEAVFLKTGRANCHLVNGIGAANGPELSAIGARRNAKHLRESVVTPKRFLPDEFLLVQITDANGRTVNGVKANLDLSPFSLHCPAAVMPAIRRRR